MTTSGYLREHSPAAAKTDNTHSPNLMDGMPRCINLPFQAGNEDHLRHAPASPSLSNPLTHHPVPIIPYYVKYFFFPKTFFMNHKKDCSDFLSGSPPLLASCVPFLSVSHTNSSVIIIVISFSAAGKTRVFIRPRNLIALLFHCIWLLLLFCICAANGERAPRVLSSFSSSNKKMPKVGTAKAKSPRLSEQTFESLWGKQGTCDPIFWKRLCPGLKIGETREEKISGNALAFHSKPLVKRLSEDGYFQLSKDELALKPDTALLSESILRLEEAGWPASFIMMFDETWTVADQASVLPEVLRTTRVSQLLHSFSLSLGPLHLSISYSIVYCHATSAYRVKYFLLSIRWIR